MKLHLLNKCRKDFLNYNSIKQNSVIEQTVFGLLNNYVFFIDEDNQNFNEFIDFKLCLIKMEFSKIGKTFVYIPDIRAIEEDDFAILKQRIKDKGLRLVVADLPTTHTVSKGMTGEILTVINHMLIDLLATMAKLDNDKRRERIKQGLANSGYKPTGKKANTTKHNRIRELASQNNMTKEEIAKAVGVGVATVYRVLKQG